MTEYCDVDERIKKAQELKDSLEKKLEKVKGTPREEEFNLQIKKLDELLNHLKEKK